MTEPFDYALGLGSNIGDGAEIINRAYSLLDHQGIRLVKASPLYLTPPWGYENQPPFTNSCCLVRSSLDPLILLAQVKEIESLMGRKPEFRWGPRLIDIDLLLWMKGSFHSDKLNLPHKDILNRAFVLIPLADLLPDISLNGQTLSEALSSLDHGEIRLHPANLPS